MAKEENRHRVLELTIHLMAWLVVFFFPQMIFVREEDFISAIPHMLPLLVGPALLAIVFYVNYLWLVPHVLVHHDVKRFLIVNFLVVLFVQAGADIWNYSYWQRLEREELTRWENEEQFKSPTNETEEFRKPGPHANCPPAVSSRPMMKFRDDGNAWVEVLVTVRDVFIYILLIVLAIVLHMSYRFRQAEMARKQAELRRTETELQSVKNQVSPHFLLNTLNNIYALVLIDSEKAQEAIVNLSRLLSHMLYQNQDDYTTLEHEIDFLHRYVDLIKLRISSDVRVSFTCDIDGCGQLPVPSLLYISLVENAFKHGICGNDGYVSIHISALRETGEIKADIRNSNHPKSPVDKSGHGVGLQLVRRRLELLYPNHFTWRYGVNTNINEYFSILKIQTK